MIHKSRNLESLEVYIDLGAVRADPNGSWDVHDLWHNGHGRFAVWPRLLKFGVRGGSGVSRGGIS